MGSTASTRTESFHLNLSVSPCLCVSHTLPHTHTPPLLCPSPSSLCLPRHVSEREHMDQACEKRRRFKNMRAQSQTRRLCLSFFASGSPVCPSLFTSQPFNRHHVLKSISQSFPLFSRAVIPILFFIVASLFIQF